MTETVNEALPGAQDESGGAKEKATAAAGAAQEQAGQLASTAKEQAADVVGTAKDQAAHVLGDAGEQARSLLADAQAELTTQAASQKERAVTGLRALSKDLGSMAENSEQPGVAAHVVAEAARRSGSFAEFLDAREPGHLLEELRTLGRQRTGAFLLGAAALGFASGRLLKNAKADGETAPDPAAQPRTGAVAERQGSDLGASLASPPVGNVAEYGSLARTPHLLPDDDV